MYRVLKRKHRAYLLIFFAFIFSLSIICSVFFEKNRVFPKCPRCKKAIQITGNSSPRDLVISSVFGRESSAQVFLRSLRSVGCKAKVVLISNSSVSENQVQFAKICGAEYFIMKSPDNSTTFYPHSLRYIGYSQFFQSNRDIYDRILHSDSFDVYFQSDPFTENIEKQNLYFAMEGIPIGNSTWNTGWLNRAYNESVSFNLSNYEVSCSGTVIGGFDQFKKYLNTMLSHSPFWNNGRHSLDQAYHNFLLHTGQFQREGVNTRFLGCDSHILTMHYCSRHGKEVISDHQIRGPLNLSSPAIVHQYNLFPRSSDIINRLCPKNRL